MANRKERRAARTEGQLGTAAFLKLADKFIDVANRHNERIKATELHMAFVYAPSPIRMRVPSDHRELRDLIRELNPLPHLQKIIA